MLTAAAQVWPFVGTGDVDYSISGTAYGTAVPTGLFVSNRLSMQYVPGPNTFMEFTDLDATGSEPIPTLNEFLAVAAKRGASNPYAVIKQLYPHMVFPNDDGKYATNLSSMNAFESCQCFAGPLNSDGLPNYQAYSDYAGQVAGGDRVTWGCTEFANAGTPDHELCSPQRQGGHTTAWRCSGRKGGGHSCYSTRRPQTPGPFPRSANWADADIPRQGSSTPPSISDDDIVANLGASGAKPRWWTEALDGLPAVRAGVLALIDESIWKNPEKWLSTKKAFKKRLYRVSNPDMTEFGYADLEAFVDVGILDIGDAEDTMFVVPNRADEEALYVRTETRDLCNDFGRTDNDTDWAAHTLSDDLFRAVTAGTPVEYATEDPAAYWNMTGNVAVCAGNLHGMPSNMPGARQSPSPLCVPFTDGSTGVCGPIPALEAASAASRNLNDVPCSRTGIELPVCGNPSFNTDDKTMRPILEGSQYAHYCSPTSGIEGYVNTSVGTSPTLLQCFDDVLVRRPRSVRAAPSDPIAADALGPRAVLLWRRVRRTEGTPDAKDAPCIQRVRLDHRQRRRQQGHQHVPRVCGRPHLDGAKGARSGRFDLSGHQRVRRDCRSGAAHAARLDIPGTDGAPRSITALCAGCP